MNAEDVLVAASFFPGETRSFWESSLGQEVLSRSLVRLARVARSNQALILASDPALVSPLLPEGFEFLKAPVPLQTCHGDSLLTMARVLNQMGRTARTVLLVDLLFPFDIQEDPFGTALDLYHGSGTGLVLSVAECQEHPCQLVRSESLAASGMVHLFEDDASARARLETLPPGARLSRPFPWNWLGHGIFDAQAQDAFVFKEGARGLEAVRLEEALAEKTPRAVLLWEDRETARIVVGKAHAESVLRKAGQESGRELAGWSMEEDGHLVVAEQEEPGKLILRAVPDDGFHRMTVQPVPVGAGSGRDWSGAASGLAVDISGGALPCGFLFTLLARAEDGRGDVVRRFESDEMLWSFNWGDGSIVNASTGKTVAGRQDFVHVYSPDGALAAGDGGLLRDWPDPLHSQDWTPLPDVAGIRIDTTVKMLRYRARMRARGV